MPLSRTAFCYIDDGMEQFGSHNIFYKYEKRRDETYHILFIGQHVIELRHIYMFQLRDNPDDILIIYRDHDFGNPKTFILKHETPHSYGPTIPTDIELIELYEWFRVKLFNPSLQHQTSPSLSCNPPSQVASLSLPSSTSCEKQSDPTYSSSGPSSSDHQKYDEPFHA